MTSLDTIMAAKNAEELRQSLQALYPALETSKLGEIIILGAADEGERLAGICRDKDIKVAHIVDDNAERQAAGVAGMQVEPFDVLTDADRSVPVIIASHRTLGATKRLIEAGFETVAPFAVLEVCDPETFPPHMFYDGWLEDLIDNRERYIKLGQSFIDDFSREVLDRVLAYRLTLDARVLDPVIDWDLYAPRDGMAFGKNEIIVDGGAYDGDSVQLFIDRLESEMTQAFAFEPDPVTFERLEARFVNDDRVVPVNKGLYDKEGILHFDDAGTRGSLLVEDGGIEVPVTALDDVVGDAPVSMIKMNIEGAELAALDGARRTITSHKPKLMISAYHRPTDLWDIADKIREIEPSYKLQLRQHDGGVIETVIYALQADGHGLN